MRISLIVVILLLTVGGYLFWSRNKALRSRSNRFSLEAKKLFGRVLRRIRGGPSFKRRLLTKAQEDILKQHEQWIEHVPEAGARADFSNQDLSGVDLSGRDLRGANLRGARLVDAVVKGARLNALDVAGRCEVTDLTGADLTRADLGGGMLQRALLRNAILRDAILCDADFTEADGLLGDQLSGADLHGAKLPDGLKEFQAIKIVEDAAEYSRKVFTAMLAACVYSWLTIATTSDTHLVTNTVSSSLPFVGVTMQVAGFYIAAPLVLLAVSLYLSLNMQRLWEQLAFLPAVLPDGRSLDKAVDPWLIVGMIRSHFKHLRSKRPPLSRLQYLMSAVLIWWLVPFTLFLFWLRYLTREDWWGTLVQVSVLVISVTLAHRFQMLTRRTLRLAKGHSLWRRALGYAASVAVMAILGSAFLLLSAGIIQVSTRGPKVAAPTGDINRIERDPPIIEKITDMFGIHPVDKDLAMFVTGWSKKNPRAHDAQSWVPRLFVALRYRPYVDVQGQQVSAKPLAWIGDKRPIELVTGAELLHTRMRYLQGWSAFLVRANLRSADLMGAQLRNADLTSANLNGACLAWSDLGYAALEDTQLNDADLAGATLIGARMIRAQAARADFSGDNLIQADLQAANVKDAKFPGAMLIAAKLKYAVLSGADFTGADLTNADLQGVDLSGDVRGANLRGTRLDQASLMRAQISVDQLKATKGWEGALLSNYLLDQLGLPLNYNETVLAKINADVKHCEDQAKKEKKTCSNKPVWWKPDLMSEIKFIERFRPTTKQKASTSKRK